MSRPINMTVLTVCQFWKITLEDTIIAFFPSCVLNLTSEFRYWLVHVHGLIIVRLNSRGLLLY